MARLPCYRSGQYWRRAAVVCKYRVNPARLLQKITRYMLLVLSVKRAFHHHGAVMRTVRTVGPIYEKVKTNYF